MENNNNRVNHRPSVSSNSRLEWRRFITILIIVWIVQEYIAYRFGLLFWPFLIKVWPYVIGFICIIIKRGINKDEKEQNIFAHQKGQSYGKEFFKALKKLFRKYFIESTLVVVICCITSIAYISAYATEKRLAKKVLNIVMLPDNSAEPTATNDPVTSEPKVTSVPTMPYYGQESVDQPCLQDDSPYIETNQLPEIAVRLILLQNMDYDVSETELHKIFFLDGEYAVADWSDKNIIISNVQNFVTDKQLIRHDSGYDESDVCDAVLNKIAYASQLEENMLNKNTNPTSDDMCDIIDLRTEVYEYAPSYKLSKLLRENFCMYGDAYYRQEGSLDAALILYGKSILWGFETLQYTVSDEQHKNDLKVLAERYEKLALVLDSNSDKHKYAKKLAKAFKYLYYSNL